MVSGRESNALERNDDVTQIMPTDCELERCGGAGSGREFGGEGVQVGMTGLMEMGRLMGANIEEESGMGRCVGEDEGLVYMSGLMVKGGGEGGSRENGEVDETDGRRKRCIARESHESKLISVREIL